MPHATDSDYTHITVTPLAPTFGAEIAGIDFSKPVNSETFAEIRKAIAKVGTSQSAYAISSPVHQAWCPSLPPSRP